MDKIDWKPLNTAPYNEHIIILLEDGTVHSGKRVSVDVVQYPGTPREKRFSQDEYVPIGVYATYNGEPYMLHPTSWTEFSNLF